MAELSGLRVLVVEDEPIVGMLVEDILNELGCLVIGPASRLEEALAAAESAAIDLAVLDVNLAGADSYPVAAILQRRSVPFVFATGYGERMSPFPLAPVVSKPYKAEELRYAMQLAVQNRPRSSSAPSG